MTIDCAIANVLLPANVISATLTVDINDCTEPCTVNGTVSWANTGDVASSPTNLSISYNENSIPIASAVIINPRETTTLFTFQLLNLTAGTYTIQASPNAGTVPQTVIIRTPANIVATAITPSKITCTEPCDLTVDITWINSGETVGTLIPTIIVNGAPTTMAFEPLGPGLFVTKTFPLIGLVAGTYDICADPNTFPCVRVIVVAQCTVTIASPQSPFTIYIGDTIHTVINATVIEPSVVDIIDTDTGMVVATNICTIDPSVGTCTVDGPTTGMLPGTYHFAARVTNSLQQCQSPPVEMILQSPPPCTVTIVSPQSPFTTYIGDIVHVIINATVIEPSVVELIDIESGMVVANCTIDPSIGTCTIDIDTTGATPGIYHTIARTSNSLQLCESSPVDVTLQLRPANVISATLTVDKNDCIEPCTVNGTVSWTNIGGTTNTATDLTITVNGTPMIIAPAVMIDPGQTTLIYPFQLPNLTAGTYNICASPNTGTNCQITTVRTSVTDICTWITSKGGWTNITSYDIMILVNAYLNLIPIGFPVTMAHILGAISYYLHILDSGNSFTGCSFT